MRVVLHLESEGQRRQTLWLRDNQCAEVGRIAWADLLVEDDPDVAEVHFALQCADAACRIRDLGQSGGTFVNGRRVEFSQLADGDVVRAGRTVFRVEIEEDETGGQTTRNDESRVATPVNSRPDGLDSRDSGHVPEKHSGISNECCDRRAAHAARAASLPEPEEPLCVLLKLDGDSFTDYCVWLRDNQTLQVGRSCQADFPVEVDDDLEPFHFELITDWTDCHLRPLRSGLPVLVNQRPVAARLTLRDGDRIEAGRSQFAVTIRGGRRTADAERSPDSASAPTSNGPPELRYSQQTCESGLLRYAGMDTRMSLLDVARLLTATRRLYLVINFANVRLPVPQCLGFHRDLFAGHANTPRSLGRLMLISSDDVLDLPQLWQQSIGSDAAIGVISEHPTEEVLRVLQAASVSFSSPSILREQLANLPGGFVRPLLDGIAAIVVESGEADSWCVFADPEVVPLWSELGFPNAPESEQ